MDTEYIFFTDLSGLKFNEFKSLSFREFSSEVVVRICNRLCLDFSPVYTRYVLEVSNDEYRRYNLDSLKKVVGYNLTFIPPEGGELSRESLLAFLILFDNHYIISQGDTDEKFFIGAVYPDDLLLGVRSGKPSKKQKARLLKMRNPSVPFSKHK